jgi:hypothetical protein
MAEIHCYQCDRCGAREEVAATSGIYPLPEGWRYVPQEDELHCAPCIKDAQKGRPMAHWRGGIRK